MPLPPAPPLPPLPPLPVWPPPPPPPPLPPGLPTPGPPPPESLPQSPLVDEDEDGDGDRSNLSVLVEGRCVSGLRDRPSQFRSNLGSHWAWAAENRPNKTKNEKANRADVMLHPLRNASFCETTPPMNSARRRRRNRSPWRQRRGISPRRCCRVEPTTPSRCPRAIRTPHQTSSRHSSTGEAGRERNYRASLPQFAPGLQYGTTPPRPAACGNRPPNCGIPRDQVLRTASA